MATRVKYYGALVASGADAAGLDYLPDLLPEVRIPLELPIYAGSLAALQAAVERRLADVAAHGATAFTPEIITMGDRAQVRPWHKVIMRADFTNASGDAGKLATDAGIC